MKFSRVYMLCIVAFLAVVFVAEYRMPRRFNWHPSFSAKSTQPFGSQLFDSVLKATLPNGYQVTRQTLYQLEQADTTRRQTVLVVADHLYNLENIDVKTMLRMAERGNKIILVAHGFSSQMEDTMGVYATTDWSSEPMQMGLAQHYKRDSLILWKRYGTPYWSRTFMLYPQLGSRHLLEDFDLDSIEGTSEEKVATPSKAVKRDYRVLAFSPKSDAWMMAVDFPIGKGHVFLASTPLLFTNYGILDDEGRDYVLRILNEVKDLPVVRSTAYLPTRDDAVESSPLRYFLTHRPLRWALYLTMLPCLAFLLFTARRRQRAVPVVKSPEDRSQEFVALIAGLYEQRRDWRDLTLKKFTYFAEELRRQLNIDITDTAEDNQNIPLLAHAVGMHPDEVASLLSDLRRLHLDESQITRKAMETYVKRMNEITKRIR